MSAEKKETTASAASQNLSTGPSPMSEARPAFTPQIDTTVAGIHFQNPVLTASGTFGYGKEFEGIIDLNQLGGI
ncbi:MAG: hypothetical protein KGM47_03640, partial [Acidobacteriota bacterium]|nr:hypothetical protein [Acidobacteriota bacterium]